MSKAFEIVKLILKYAWLLPVIKNIIVGIADGVKKAKADGDVTSEEVGAIIISTASSILDIFEVDDLDIKIEKK